MYDCLPRLLTTTQLFPSHIPLPRHQPRNHRMQDPIRQSPQALGAHLIKRDLLRSSPRSETDRSFCRERPVRVKVAKLARRGVPRRSPCSAICHRSRSVDARNVWEAPGSRSCAFASIGSSASTSGRDRRLKPSSSRTSRSAVSSIVSSSRIMLAARETPIPTAVHAPRLAQNHHNMQLAVAAAMDRDDHG